MASKKNESVKTKIIFSIDMEYVKKLKKLSIQKGLAINELLSNAIDEYINKIEKEKLNNELESGYKANYNYYLKSQNDWKYV